MSYLISSRQDLNNILTQRIWVSGKPLCLATRLSKSSLPDEPQTRSGEIKEHVWLMLFVSVNTPSHLQSAETLVCLHCLADCLKHTQTHTLTRRLLELKPGVHWTCLSHFHPARRSVRLRRAQTFTDYRLNRVSFVFSFLIEGVLVLFHSYRLVYDTLRQREVMGGSQVFAFPHLSSVGLRSVDSRV